MEKGNEILRGGGEGSTEQRGRPKSGLCDRQFPIVKTAFFGEDLNWGRVMCAVGYSGPPIDPDRIDVFLDQVPIVKRGVGLGETFENRARKVLKKKSFKVIVNLHQGKDEFSAFTMDFSFDYVKINASYRS